jgi:hypothetical protein
MSDDPEQQRREAEEALLQARRAAIGADVSMTSGSAGPLFGARKRIKREPPTEEERQRFLQFNYTEVKDIGKQSLTTMTAVAVFAATFGTKIFEGQVFTLAKSFFVIALALFILGIILGGRGLYLMFMAGERANGPVVFHSKADFRDLALKSYKAFTFAEVCYAVGLFLFLGSAAIQLLLKT